jgi:hypothetical protein
VGQYSSAQVGRYSLSQLDPGQLSQGNFAYRRRGLPACCRPAVKREGEAPPFQVRPYNPDRGMRQRRLVKPSRSRDCRIIQPFVTRRPDKPAYGQLMPQPITPVSKMWRRSSRGLGEMTLSDARPMSRREVMRYLC